MFVRISYLKPVGMRYEIDTKYLKYIVDGQIWEGAYKPNIPTVDLKVAKEIVQERLALQGEKSIRLLLHGETKIPMTDEGREYLASPEGGQRIAAAAILVNSWTMNALVNFILVIKTKNFPINAFQNPKRAKEWLLKTNISAPETTIMTKSHGQQQFDHLFDQSPAMAFILDHRGLVVRASFQACKQLGYTEEQLTGRPFSRITKGEYALVDGLGRPILVELKKTLFPEDMGAYPETLVIATEINAAAVDRTTAIVAATQAFGLKDSQFRLIELIVSGCTTKEIAEILGRKPRTIESRRKALLKKLHVEKTAELIQKVNDLGIVQKKP